ncbi:hypothetical protein [Candidatus Sneabacter namystus]|uniref:Uncharacterized protein n=1 Tax=Candidatus Sneabacter namystus TaxID=2601646 RepID=A0A5C0UJI3_9RICK|nr:hypothetical protein [Candidatus Sneabacter namystus]QEK39632.1 hypothetical protein FZC37_01635 [Candidatus Sneabacter namystus]
MSVKFFSDVSCSTPLSQNTNKYDGKGSDCKMFTRALQNAVRRNSHYNYKAEGSNNFSRKGDCQISSDTLFRSYNVMRNASFAIQEKWIDYVQDLSHLLACYLSDIKKEQEVTKVLARYLYDCFDNLRFSNFNRVIFDKPANVLTFPAFAVFFSEDNCNPRLSIFIKSKSYFDALKRNVGYVKEILMRHSAHDFVLDFHLCDKFEDKILESRVFESCRVNV